MTQRRKEMDNEIRNFIIQTPLPYQEFIELVTLRYGKVEVIPQSALTEHWYSISLIKRQLEENTEKGTSIIIVAEDVREIPQVIKSRTYVITQHKELDILVSILNKEIRGMSLTRRRRKK